MNKQETIDAEVVPEGGTTALVPLRSDLMTLSAYEDSLDAYLNRIAQIPLLSPEDEVEYARRYRDHKDMQAAQYLVLSNLRFVVYVAKGFKGYGLPLADIIQEGNVGLMKAVSKYDPDKDVRFISYAVYWIRCDINEYIIKNMRMVRSVTSKNRRKLLFNLSKHMKDKSGTFTYDQRQALAKEYGVSIQDIDVVEMALLNHDSSVEHQSAQGVAMSDLLPDGGATPEQTFEQDNRVSQHQLMLQEMLASLTERQRDILQARWLSGGKVSLEQLAQKYNVSMQRVSQIEKQALQKCREFGVVAEDLLLSVD